MKNNLREKGGQKNILIIVGVIVITVLIASIVFSSLKGETTSSGSLNEDEKTTSLTCIAQDFSYPFFDYDEATKKEATINVIFTDDQKINSIALTYKMYYDGGDKASSSVVINHASMNKSFGSELEPDALSVNYYHDDGMMRMQLYATNKDLNEKTKKYFLLNTTQGTLKNIKNSYMSQGFNCTERQ